MAKKDLKFLKHAIKDKSGRKSKVWYSQGELYGYPKGTVTVYAKEYGSQLPKELKPENDRDMMTDLIAKDRARITPKSKYYKEVLKLLKK